ncbi:MAG: serine/threonine protein kinase [Planctomycetes bacterium]|nr:serine/threonine protein kinase [Planctomycetota bacterium]
MRQRLAADLAAGRTIALSPTEMGDPELREELPALLEEVGRAQPRRSEFGLRIRGYTVLGEIGTGGMSTVYLARHDQLGRHVALKIVQTTAGGEARARERLLREARAMAALKHPNIVTVYDVVEAGEVIAIAMEWIDGLTLAGILKVLPPQPTAPDMTILRQKLGTPPGGSSALESTVVRTFVRMMRDVAQAVDCAHRAGMLHLDIKPSNVLVRRDGTALLADFGVVREIDLTSTHTQSFAGTPIYAAPEQLRRDDASFGQATDVYGLGMTLYELLARQQPLRREGLGELLRRIEGGRLPKLSTICPVASDLENIVHKAIAVEPANRYPTPAELAKDLQAFLDGRPVGARRTPPMQRLKRWARAEPWKAGLVVALAVMVPVLVGLGAKLLLEMPRIQEARLREQRIEAANQAQYAFQSFLVLEAASETSIAKLRAEYELAPRDPTLAACLLTFLGQSQSDEARREFASMPTWVLETAGAQAMAHRLATRRPFFSDEEAEQLGRSDDLLDLLLVALDRVLLQRDTLVDEHLRWALPVVARLNAGYREANPLVRGVEAWINAQLGDRAGLDAACWSLGKLWHDNEAACLWRMLATAEVDRTAARAIADEFLAAHPGNYPVTVRAVAMLFDLERYDDAIRLLRAAEPQGDRAHHHRDLMTAKALFCAGREDEARRLFASIPRPDEESRGDWLAVCAILEPDTARPRYELLLRDPCQSAAVFEHAIAFAADMRDRDLLQRAMQAAAAAHPYRAKFRWRLARALAAQGNLLAAGAAADGLTLPKVDADAYAHGAAMGLCATKKFDQLRALAERWQQLCREDEWRMAYYLGVARARTGDYEDAMAAFTRHRTAAKASGRAEMIGAVLEEMWIRVMPGGPPNLRDVGRARQLLGSPAVAEAIRKGRDWFYLIAAEVWFQSGDRNKALDLVERGLAPDCQPYFTAPADVADRLRAALVRYRE